MTLALTRRSAKFKDRAAAGRRLAAKLRSLNLSDAVVLGLPRGGVETASVVADSLQLPLGIIMVRKIGHPDNPEYAVGAISELGAEVFSNDIKSIDPAWLSLEIARQSQQIKSRRSKYKAASTTIDGKTAILVDDGIATGLSMEAAIKEARLRLANPIIVAVPVASLESLISLSKSADKIITLVNPTEANLSSVGAYYENFDEVSDNRVAKLLERGLKDND